jgi:cobaltochelatase CobS
MQEFRHLYQGANIMNEAFLDRWRCYFIDYMKPEDEVKVIIGALPRFAKAESAVQTIVKVVGTVRKAFAEEEVACTFSTRRAIDWAELMLRYKDPTKSAEIAVFSKINKTDAEVIRGIIQRIMTKK